MGRAHGVMCYGNTLLICLDPPELRMFISLIGFFHIYKLLDNHTSK